MNFPVRYDLVDLNNLYNMDSFAKVIISKEMESPIPFYSFPIVDRYSKDDMTLYLKREDIYLESMLVLCRPLITVGEAFFLPLYLFHLFRLFYGGSCCPKKAVL